MADIFWQAGGGGDMNNSASYSTGAVPSSPGNDGDNFIFPANVATGPSLNMAQLAGVSFAKVIVDPGFTPNLGSSGAPLETVATNKLVHAGSGTFYYKGSATATTVIAMCLGTKTSGDGALSITGTAITRIAALRGKTVITATAATPTNVYVGYVNNPNDALLVMDSVAEGTADVDNMFLTAGTVLSSRQIDNLYMSGGYIKQGVDNDEQIDNIYQCGGRIDYFSDEAITLLVGLAGTLDLTKKRATRTITTRYIMPGFDLINDADFESLTTDVRFDDLAKAFGTFTQNQGGSGL